MKELEIANKERVEFLITKSTYAYTSGSTTYSNVDEYDGASNSQTMVLLLDRLANKEIIVELDQTSDDGNNVRTTTGTKTYTQVEE